LACPDCRQVPGTVSSPARQVVGAAAPAGLARVASGEGESLKEVDVTAAKKAARSAPTTAAAAGRRSSPKKAARAAKRTPTPVPRASAKRAAAARKPPAGKKAAKNQKVVPAPKKAAATKVVPVKKVGPVKKATPAKKAAPAARAAAAPAKKAPPAKKAAPAAPKRPSIGPYAKDQKFLDEQRALLLDERSVYAGQATDLRAEADSLALEREPGDVQFDEESGEGGTVTVDRERNLALSAQASAAVEEIDDALRKIERKTYGACERCHQPIPKARLRALPFARLCVACKSGGLSRR
jgi:DnaK suppressor protein